MIIGGETPKYPDLKISSGDSQDMGINSDQGIHKIWVLTAIRGFIYYG